MYEYVGKLPKQNCSVRLFSNPGDIILNLLKFIEARISEWNKGLQDNFGVSKIRMKFQILNKYN